MSAPEFTHDYDVDPDHLAPLSGQEAAFPVEQRGRTSVLWSLLDECVVLPEEWDELDSAVRQELLAVTDPDRLLPRLRDLHLLTPFQAEAIRAGVGADLIIGHYRLLDLIGRGGMGTVYRAEHIHLRREVAVKVLNREAGGDARRLHRFFLEARAVARLRHPNIVACLDAGRDTRPEPNPGPRDYYVMELVQGQDLYGLVQDRGPLPIHRACDLFRQVAGALGEAHRHGLVHRDIKPSNLLVTPDWQAKVLDFGLARHPRRNVTEPGTLLGTIGYMAPEQASDPHAVDARADLFSLGASLYWALTGRAPFPDTGAALADLTHRLTAPPPSLRAARPELPAELGELVGRLMDPDPTQRLPSMTAAAASLTPFARWQSEAPRTGLAGPARPTILVIDDEPQFRDYVRTVAGEELACEGAADAEAGWAALGRRRFDLVVLDVDLPGESGAELAARIRREGPDPHVKVLLTSGVVPPETLGGLLPSGADDFLAKPFSAGEFRSRARALLARGKATTRPARETVRVGVAALNRVTLADPPATGCDNLAPAVSRLLEEVGLAKRGHAARIRRYVRTLAAAVCDEGEYARLKDPAYLELLVAVAPVYDIGVLTLPTGTLMKPGPLDSDEVAVIHGHAAAGSEILVDLAAGNQPGLPALALAAEVARSHHERWDGTGYPDGLTGRLIPLSARVVAIASAYEAMRSRRPYRPPLGHAWAVRFIAQESNGQFDPALRVAFETAAGEFDRIFRDAPA